MFFKFVRTSFRVNAIFIRKLTSYLLSILFLSGCSTTFDFRVPDITPAQNKVGVTLRYLRIDSYPPKDENKSSEEMPQICLASEFSSNDPGNIIISWGEALKDALKRVELFEKSARRAELFVSILEFETPSFGLDMTTRVTARYNIVDIATDTILHSDTVKSEATVPGSYAFLGTKRATESVNQAIRKNIATFISNIKHIDLTILNNLERK